MNPRTARIAAVVSAREELERMARVLNTYLVAEDPEDAGRILEQSRATLLTEEALAFLDSMIFLARHGDEADGARFCKWERWRELLADAIADGIPIAVQRANERRAAELAIILEYLFLLPGRVRAFLDAHRSLLLDEEIIILTQGAGMLHARDQEPLIAAMIELRLRFQREARDQGTEKAWRAYRERVSHLTYGNLPQLGFDEADEGEPDE